MDIQQYNFVRVQAETVGVKSAMNRLKAVVNGGEGAVSAESDAQLSVIGVLGMVNVSEGRNDNDSTVGEVQIVKSSGPLWELRSCS